MRAIAKVNSHPKVKRVMLYEDSDGVYLFLYDTDEDSFSSADYLQDTIEDVKTICWEDYGVEENDWQVIGEPMENCQHDWIDPVRIKGINNGKPEFEKLVNGKWIDIKVK